MNNGIFTHPGPNGIFGRGGETKDDGAAPPVDSDGIPLRETLVAVAPSPGHIRVARATRDPKSGKTEYQEQYREPTEEELEILKRQGVIDVQSGMMIGPQPTAQMSGYGRMGDLPLGTSSGETGFFATIKNQPWGKIALGAGVGALGLYAVSKWVMPMFSGRDDDEDEGDEAEEDEE